MSINIWTYFDVHKHFLIEKFQKIKILKNEHNF